MRSNKTARMRQLPSPGGRCGHSTVPLRREDGEYMKGGWVRSYDQPFPPSLPRHVPPVDALPLSSVCAFVVNRPHCVQQLFQAAEAAKLRYITHLRRALSEDRPEGRAWKRHGAADEQRPDQGPVEPVWAGRNEVHMFTERGDEVGDVMRGRVEIWQ